MVVKFYFSGAWALTLSQTMMSGMNRSVLTALPLFVLAGGLMNAGGISARLFEFARAMVGWMRGGLAHVNVMTSMFFGGMIGLSTADLAGTGSIVIPAMKKNGYPADFSAAVTASSAGLFLHDGPHGCSHVDSALRKCSQSQSSFSHAFSGWCLR